MRNVPHSKRRSTKNLLEKVVMIFIFIVLKENTMRLELNLKRYSIDINNKIILLT